MTDFLAVVDPLLRPIIALGSLATSGGVIALYTANRKSKAALLAIEVGADDRLNTHYAAELAALRDQVIKTGDSARARATEAEERHARAMRTADERFDRAMRSAAEREQACEDRVTELRDEVRKLSEEIIGFRKNVGQRSLSAIRLNAPPSSDIAEAAVRAVDALDGLGSTD